MFNITCKINGMGSAARARAPDRSDRMDCTHARRLCALRLSLTHQTWRRLLSCKCKA